MRVTVMHASGVQSGFADGNWAQSATAVQQRWCSRRPPRFAPAIHVAQPATEQAATDQQSLIRPAASLKDPQYVVKEQDNAHEQLHQGQVRDLRMDVLGQIQQQHAQDTEHMQQLTTETLQQRLVTADSIAAASSVGNGSQEPLCHSSQGHAAAAAAAAAAAGEEDNEDFDIDGHMHGTEDDSDVSAFHSTRGISSNGSNSYHAAHYSWHSNPLVVLDSRDDVQDTDDTALSSDTSKGSSIIKDSGGSSHRSADDGDLQVQMDSWGYYTYTAAQLQAQHGLPSVAAQQQPEQQRYAQQQQQQQQQQQRHPLQRAINHQQLDSHALRDAQLRRERSNRNLTAKIRDSQDLNSLRHIIRQYEGVLNHIHVTALFVRLTKLTTSKGLQPRDMLALPAVLSQVLALTEAAVPDMDERGISNCLHCMAVLELDQERQLLHSFLASAENVFHTSGFKPQGLANLSWALGSLHANLGPRVAAQLLAAAAGSSGRFSAQELAQYGWGVANLRLRVDETWLELWHKAAARVLPQVTPQGLSMLLWSTARLLEAQHVSVPATPMPTLPSAPASFDSSSSSNSSEGQQLAWVLAAEDVFEQHMSRHTPHSVSICLWAWARLGHRPKTRLTSAALSQVQPQLLTSATPSDLAVLMYSLAMLGYRPSTAWLHTHAAAVRRQLPRMGLRRIANMLWALAKLGLKLSVAELLEPMVQALYASIAEANARDLANTLWALATLDYLPSKPVLEAIGAQAQAMVHDFSPQEISNLLWAYAKLDVQPPHKLLGALWESIGVSSVSSGDGSGSSGAGSVGARLSAFKPQELSMLVWALAVLQLVPAKPWWDQFLQSSYHKMGLQTPQSLATIIWSLAELKLQPPPAWLYHWAAATRSVLGAMNPVDLGQVATALQGSTFKLLQLPKLEALLQDVLDRLSLLEAERGAYSRAAVHMLLNMQTAVAQQGKYGSSSFISSSSRSPPSRVRRAALIGGNGSNNRSVALTSSTQAVIGERSLEEQSSVRHSPIEDLASKSSSSSNGSICAEELEQLKDYLVNKSFMEGSSSLDDVPDVCMER